MSVFEIKMPKLGESITEGTIIAWSVKIGDMVNEDDVLFEVNTAKVSAEIPSPVAGKIIEIRFKEGDTVSVGTVVAIVQLDGEEEPETPQSGTQPTVAAEPDVVKEDVARKDDDRWYSPVVQAKAKEAGITEGELSTLQGTGYLNRLTKRDIEAYIEKKETVTPKAAAPVAAVKQGEEAIPMDPVRRIIADRMVASKHTSAHVTNVVEADVTRLVKWREGYKEEFRKREGMNLTYMPVVAEAVVQALQQFPRVNSSVDGYTIIQKKQIHIGIAVSLDDGNLIVPVVKNADKLNIAGLASAIAGLAGKARGNALIPDDIQGSTFTITNFGSFKSLFGTPIINQPEVAILGIGAIEKKPAVLETPDGDVIAIRHKMYLSLSYDHRVIDGALGGQFLKAIANYLENWKVEN